MAAAFAILVACPVWAQSGPRGITNANPRQPGYSAHRLRQDPTLTADEGLAVIAAALDARKLKHSGDCSHLVHAIYSRAGFSYTYATSFDLYDGVEGFQRVSEPQPGDLVVWRGHVGIVVMPSRHIFFSFRSSGPGTADYTTSYWTKRGRARFYRYVKDDPCPGCVLRARRGE